MINLYYSIARKRFKIAQIYQWNIVESLYIEIKITLVTKSSSNLFFLDKQNISKQLLATITTHSFHCHFILFKSFGHPRKNQVVSVRRYGSELAVNGENVAHVNYLAAWLHWQLLVVVAVCQNICWRRFVWWLIWTGVWHIIIILHFVLKFFFHRLINLLFIN